MQIQDYAELDALAIAELVRRGEVTAGEVTEAAVAAIEAVNPAVNAVVLLDADGARAQAAAVDRDAPLAGVPMLIKDNNLHVAGWPTTFSCRFFADAEAMYTFEGTREVNTLIVGRALTGRSAFTR